MNSMNHDGFHDQGLEGRQVCMLAGGPGKSGFTSQERRRHKLVAVCGVKTLLAKREGLR